MSLVHFGSAHVAVPRRIASDPRTDTSYVAGGLRLAWERPFHRLRTKAAAPCSGKMTAEAIHISLSGNDQPSEEVGVALSPRLRRMLTVRVNLQVSWRQFSLALVMPMPCGEPVAAGPPKDLD